MTLEEQPTTPKTILLVEDDEAISELLTHIITMETDYNVLTMSSDAEVITRLAEIQEIKPVLFLLDYQLPTMTSLELYDILHKQKGLESVPTIIITALQFNEYLERRLQERNVTKLEKPFDLEDFLCYIEQTLMSIPSTSNTPSMTAIRTIISGHK